MQKCIISANPDFKKPGDIFRRVIECVAGGIFLPGGVLALVLLCCCEPLFCGAGGTGLLDPCEKGTVDAAALMAAQERANITLSAQVCWSAVVAAGY